MFDLLHDQLTLAKALTLYLVASHSQEENGGALELHRGSIVVFEGTAGFTSISVKAADETDTDDLPRKGGAVHNEVMPRVLFLPSGIRRCYHRLGHRKLSKLLSRGAPLVNRATCICNDRGSTFESNEWVWLTG